MKNTNKLSVIIICMNEEDKIERCLSSVTWADEIIVVDSGSTDSTLEIVKKYTDKIVINTDWKGFGTQKRMAEQAASNDWVLSLDSDEVVTEQLRDEIIKCLESVEKEKVYRINRLTYFCGKYIRHSGWHPDRIVRLYNKSVYHFNDALVHESVNCKQAIKIDLNSKLHHFTGDSLSSYINKRNKYAKIWSHEKYKKGKAVNIPSIILHTLFAFIRHYLLKKGFLDGYHGFLISVIQMQYTFNKYNYLRFLYIEQETKNKRV